MNLPRILIIDDRYGHDKVERRLFCEQLRLWDMDEVGGDPPSRDKCLAQVSFCSGQSVEVGDGEEYVSNDMEYVLESIRRGWPFEDGGRWSLILIDYQFPTGRREGGKIVSAPQRGDAEFGEEIVRRIIEEWPFKPLFEGEGGPHPSDIPFAMFSMCDPDKVEPRVDPLGSRGYMKRPESLTGAESVFLRQQLADLLFDHGLVEDGALRAVTPKGEVDFVAERRIIGQSLALLRALRRCRAASSREGLKLILLYGEIGTGKELFAEYIHRHSRQGRRYYPQHLSAKPETLIESELFGYEKYSFTGGNPQGKEGLLESVRDGTLFLDEIGKYPPEVLELLLRPAAGGSFTRIGGVGNHFLKCQVVCATNLDIRTLVSKRGFPEDMRSRFDAAITLPPLSAREGDIRVLFDYFVKSETERQKYREKKPTDEAYRWVEKQFPWQFNVRQLENAARRVVNDRKHSGTIQVGDLEAILAETSWQDNGPRPPSALEDFNSLMGALEGFQFPAGDFAQVHGAMPRFNQAAGGLISRMLEATVTLPGHTHPDGTPVFSRCVSTIHGEEVSGADVKNYVKKLQANFKLDSGSKVVGKFVEKYPWADGRRGGEQ